MTFCKPMRQYNIRLLTGSFLRIGVSLTILVFFSLPGSGTQRDAWP